MAWTRRAYDQFNDTALTSLASHTPDEGSAWALDEGGTFRIALDGASCYNTSAPYARNTTSLGDIQAASVVVKVSSTAIRWVAVRFTAGSGGSGYIAWGRSSGTRLYRYDNGSGTLLDSDATGISVNDVLRIEATGDAIRLLVNGVERCSATDGDYTSGSAAMFAADVSGGDLDTFEAFDDAGGGGGSLPATQTHVRQAVHRAAHY